jgi:DNA-binding MarR family transcriptional regulator
MNRERQGDELPIPVVQGDVREESDGEKWYQDLVVSWIFQTCIRLQISLDRRFLRFRVTAQEARVLLCCVEARVTTPGQLAIMVARDKGKITRVVDRLEARGLVRREVLQRDRRFAVIRATAKGRQIAKELALVFDNTRKTLFEGIPEIEIRRLGEMLPKLHKNATLMGTQQGKDKLPHRAIAGGVLKVQYPKQVKFSSPNAT